MVLLVERRFPQVLNNLGNGWEIPKMIYKQMKVSVPTPELTNVYRNNYCFFKLVLLVESFVTLYTPHTPTFIFTFSI